MNTGKGEIRRPMEASAVGMLEFTGIAAGMNAADRMVKASDVDPLFFKTVCPGKFVAAVCGDVAAVDAAVQAGRSARPEAVADWFVIPNIHPDVVAALSGCVQPAERSALGVIETFSVAAAINAADAAVKASGVQLLDVRTALGLGGKAYVLLGGDVAAVQAAVESGSARAAESGLLVGNVVIPRPADSFYDQII
ncbi:BMC domain-containing protein [Desulfovibrio sp. OttesenSCG-928-C06]|nr:BMC domain-containing protein [Desulfovibrio sp. OttesenSCG-928-C06]